ncbi:nucleotide exchange factor GrpE [Heliobacterium gestii]|uniref:Nucleotide exchange factor GrpE n=1 Tax=Heliomicrobium gestii TaxID=2699 RepID=A0A845LAI3_HELGE|nr:nucleotide exchange factor GrpE [Heliomicrobium gestii]MBM7865691.1 molecular chaperone GrpE (heat shock protein) [Heliomicrobium gestii]MZP41940.1 nucleotide exchange factor GrpE [Heliomicrobium gestii]
MTTPVQPDTLEEMLALRDYCYAACEQGSAAEARIAKTVFDWLGNILRSMDVETILKDGKFQPGAQHIVGKVPTDSPEQDLVIKSTIRPGYRLRERLIRAQEVVVYGYEAE